MRIDLTSVKCPVIRAAAGRADEKRPTRKARDWPKGAVGSADSGLAVYCLGTDCDDDGASRRPPETHMQPSPLGPSIGTPQHTTLPRATPACVGDNEAGRPSGETMRATMRATKMLVSSHLVGAQQPQQPRKVAHGQQLQPLHAQKPGTRI